jgi:glycosyltransferase involved in cell wall biosynthesis
VNIAVITPSLPTRAGALAEAIVSVAAQTRLPHRHLVEVDHHREGSSTLRNRMADNAWECDWLAFLDDDDILYPQHLESLAEKALAARADLVYSFCDVQGRDGWNPSRPFDADALRVGNYIPVTVLVRRGPFMAAQGFPSDAEHGWEDHALWLKLLDTGCRFACVETPTWCYRLHPGSKTYVGQENAS